MLADELHPPDSDTALWRTVRIRWPDVLNFTLAVMALSLGVVTFYYQFIRQTRGLTAQFLNGLSENGETRMVLLVRNTGNRDEVINEASVVLEKPGDFDLLTRPLFQIDVVKAGEARRIESIFGSSFEKLVENSGYEWATRDVGAVRRRHSVALKIVVVDEQGRWIETRHRLGYVEVDASSEFIGSGYSTQSNQVFDLLHPKR